ncbi:LicD family protein [Vagococcus intermedius]|uniref:LicD family protein n=1 Tax=Vagococcus intermedius TaxID=2991418 RepID=A0AAF0CVI2_9ENTE|nr:LicD family protein [Vagococcus intermedius]WEG73795.1 LicD family protein [Vagococcus intermedius]WEG75880.1 LicD family protein [Vagococcus intermedius]
MSQGEKVVELREIQLVQLEILKEIDTLCKRNNIQYFLVGGSLLGAVRHGGFIPWDDDLDIGMTRDNYIKFVAICKKEIDDKYFLQNVETDPNYGLIFSKVRKNNTLYTEESAQYTQAKDGVFIDVFCYSDLPSNNSNKYEKSIYLLKRLLLLKKDYIFWNDSNFKKKIIYRMLLAISKLCSSKKLINKINKIIFFKDANATKVVNYGGSYSFRKESMDKIDTINLTEIEFENQLFPVPKNYKKILTHVYGDYLKLPPEEKRNNRHGIINIKL